MKLILAIVLAAVAIGFPNEIAKINHHKSEAQKSYLEGNYQAAIEHYGILIDSFQVDEEEILMNYANAAFLMTKNNDSPAQGIEGPANSGSTPSGEQSERYQRLAQSTYTNLAQNAPSNMKSIAFNQLGVMAFNNTPPPKPSKDVLRQVQGLFKSALKTDQNNQQARFNYELVTKLLEQEEENQQDQEQDQDQDQDQEKEEEQEKEQQQNQENQEQQQQENQDQEQQSGEDQEQDESGKEENSEQQEGDPKESEENQSEEQQGEENPKEQPLNASPEKMEELQISEEKARMILEAMKNSEVQYIQQNQRKAAKKQDNGKPDW